MLITYFLKISTDFSIIVILLHYKNKIFIKNNFSLTNLLKYFEFFIDTNYSHYSVKYISLYIQHTKVHLMYLKN